MEWEEEEETVGRHLEEEELTTLMTDVMSVAKEAIMPEIAIGIGVLVAGHAQGPVRQDDDLDLEAIREADQGIGVLNPAIEDPNLGREIADQEVAIHDGDHVIQTVSTETIRIKQKLKTAVSVVFPFDILCRIIFLQ